MRAIARRVKTDAYTHRIEIRQHELAADEPAKDGGDDRGPTPQELLAASLASCMAITIDMYAKRKGWDVGLAEVECRYEQADRDARTEFEVVLRLPAELTDEQRERLRVIAGRCPVHRTLEGGVRFTDWVETLGPSEPAS
jgi:putative redox protein